MHKTPRFHEIDSTEPYVNNGYTNNLMIILHKNMIILNTKYEEKWNTYLSSELFINTMHEVIETIFQIYSLQINLPKNQKTL